MIFDNSDPANSKAVSAKQATINLIDINRFIYQIDLVEPQILITDNSSLESYSLATSDSMTMYLSLQSNDAGVVSITASQMSLSQLQEAIDDAEIENTAFRNQYYNQISRYSKDLGDELTLMEVNGEIPLRDIEGVINYISLLDISLRSSSTSYYFQYFKSEFFKKLALSFACTILVLVAFPISFVRMKYGRLFGFFISLIFVWILVVDLFLLITLGNNEIL